MTKQEAKKPRSRKAKAEEVEQDAGPGLTPEEVAANSEGEVSTLTDKQRLFVEYYLQSWNATDAARRAGYADPELSGWRNRQNEVISAEISRRISAVAMSADECLMRLGRIARGSLKPFVVEIGDDVWPDLTTEKAQENFDLLKKIKPKRRVGGALEDQWTETEVELEIHDPMKALELIGKHHKLFTDKTELSGEVKITAEELTDDELSGIATGDK